MRRAAALLLAVLALATGGAAGAAPAHDPVTVTTSRTTEHTRVGDRFGFATTVRNAGDRPLHGLVAHLNVVSLHPDVYVDPEDWSSARTQFLDPLRPHWAVTLRWKVQAVNAGDFVLYVAVTSRHGADRVVASDALRLSTAAHRGLTATSVLPTALGVPAVVAALMLAVALRRRRLS